jgi:hypothetical protein
MINWKEYGSEQLWPISKYYIVIHMEELEKP